MSGDSLSWLLFWLGIGAGILINLATGLLLSIVFVTLQVRRDLQRQLDEIWLRGTRAVNEVYLVGSLGGDKAKAFSQWVALEDEWMRARRTLKVALSDPKWDQLRASIYAIRDLLSLNADTRNDRFLRLHPTKIAGPTGTDPAEGQVDYGTWAAINGRPGEKAAYERFLTERERLNNSIEYLLYFNPDLVAKNVAADHAPSLPTELERAWHFGYLFPRIWTWFFYELFSRALGCLRESSRQRTADNGPGYW